MTNDPANRPVITGTGVVTGLGFSVLSNFEAMNENVTAVREIAGGAAAPLVAKAAIIGEPRLRAKVPEDQESQLKFLNPSGQLALNAVSEAIASAAAGGLDFDAVDPARKSLYLAQVDSRDWDCHDFRDGFVAGGAEGAVPEDTLKLNKQASRRTKPFFLLESLKNNVYSFVASWLGMMGPNTAVAGLSHAGFPAIDMAVRAMARGQLDAAMVLGAAVVSDPVARLEFGSRDQEREGDAPITPGDGAGALVIEPLHRVEARGKQGLAHITGCAAAMGEPEDGGPSAATLRSAVDRALEQAGREHIELVVVPALAGNAHKALVGIPVLSGGHALAWRPLTGHLATATEPVEVAMACAYLESGQAALLISSGFYGQAGAIVIERPEPTETRVS